ncbi:hypothetical protein [Halonatronum saccharophilum]|uniref:hypothetical protein n=1 Tax=Halonatronum saccharophilum TaxID=150060 RepID=UPI0004815FA6|nr:hypothetical protein [Halonatronum saccharophilum]
MNLDNEMEDLRLFEDNDDNVKDEKQGKYKLEKEDKKVNRSYMISTSTLSKLQELKIKNPTKNYSDIVEEAIILLYKNIKE